MIQCGQCSHSNEVFFKFCLNCGADLSRPVASPTAAPEPKAEPEPEPAGAPTDTGDTPYALGDTIEVPSLAPDTEVHADDAASTAAPAGELDVSWAPYDSGVPEREPAPEPKPAQRAPATQPGKPEWFAPTQELDEEHDIFIPPGEGRARPAETGAPEPASAPKADDSESTEGTNLYQSMSEPATDSFASEPAPMASPFDPSKRCPGCGALVEGDHVFCGQCGYRFEDSAPVAEPTPRQPASARVPSHVRLVLIEEDGSDGDSHTLSQGTNTVGRETADVPFDEDVYLSPRHADIIVDGDLVTVRSTDSINGTYIRITEPALIEHSDTFRIGQELLRYENLEKAEPVVPMPDDETELLGAPVPEGVWGRLIQLMSPDLVGNAYLLSGRFVTIGRERGDITFPADGYVSGRHATLTRRNGQLYLEDLDSSNGTYVRIKGSAAVFDGDLLLMGQQLFRITF